MFITSRFPSLGFDQFWVSPPEYFEFTEWNRSFSSVGAFTTGELNLSANDRPTAGADGQRRRRAAEDAGCAGRPRPALHGGGNAHRRSRRRDAVARDLAVRVWRSRHRRPDDEPQRPVVGGRRHHAAGLRRHGQQGRGVAAPAPGPVQPPQSRQPRALPHRPPRRRPEHVGSARRRSARCTRAGRNSSRRRTSPARTFTSSRWSRHRPRSSAAPRERSGCCRPRSASCSSSRAPTSRTCCSHGPRRGTASSPCARRLARAGGGCSASS